MSKVIRLLIVVLIAVSAVGALPAAQPAQAQTIMHTWPGNIQGWFSYSFGGAPLPTFGNGPGAPPLGTGSFGIFTSIPTGHGAGIGNQVFVGTPLSALTTISYHIYNSDSSANNWRMKLYINTTGNPSAADCAIEYVHSDASPNTWEMRVPTSAAPTSPYFGYDSGGGWVWRGDEIGGPLSCPSPTWFPLISWADVLSAHPSAVLAPKGGSGPTVILQIYNHDSSGGVSGVIDAVNINGTVWDFELEGPPATFFDPGDGRYDPRPGDRVAAYCEAKRLVIYGVAGNSRGFLLGVFDFEALKAAGEEGIYLDKGVDGVVSASMSPSGHIWVAWTGGQHNASGRPEHGFAKLVRCN